MKGVVLQRRRSNVPRTLASPRTQMHTPCLFSAPEGPHNSSHGWSAAEPVVTGENVPVPGGGECAGTRRAPVVRPLRGRGNASLFHGFRFAPPVATVVCPLRGQEGAKGGNSPSFPSCTWERNCLGSFASPDAVPRHGERSTTSRATAFPNAIWERGTSAKAASLPPHSKKGRLRRAMQTRHPAAFQIAAKPERRG